jgi:hypothetical protein
MKARRVESEKHGKDKKQNETNKKQKRTNKERNTERR